MSVKNLKYFLQKNIILLYSRQFSNVAISHVKDVANIPVKGAEMKILKVAVIGMPNAGKSTLINNLMDRRVCATSSKVHTTKKKASAIYTEGDSQIIFVDTPGIVNLQEHKKYNLDKSFLRDSRSSLHEADIVGVVHDVANPHTRDKLDLKIIRMLESHKKLPNFIILNKVDILRTKRKLLDLTRVLTDNCIDGKPIPGAATKGTDANGKEIKGWPKFKEVFMVSALTGSGLEDVKQYLTREAKPGPWLFPQEVWTNQLPETIVMNSVKAKLLDFLPQEIPYELKPEIEFFDTTPEGILRTVVLIRCPSERISKLIAGASDGKLRQITESIQHELQNTFDNFVKIKLVLDYPHLTKK